MHEAEDCLLGFCGSRLNKPKYPSQWSPSCQLMYLAVLTLGFPAYTLAVDPAFAIASTLSSNSNPAVRGL